VQNMYRTSYADCTTRFASPRGSLCAWSPARFSSPLDLDAIFHLREVGTIRLRGEQNTSYGFHADLLTASGSCPSGHVLYKAPISMRPSTNARWRGTDPALNITACTAPAIVSARPDWCAFRAGCEKHSTSALRKLCSVSAEGINHRVHEGEPGLNQSSPAQSAETWEPCSPIIDSARF